MTCKWGHPVATLLSDERDTTSQFCRMTLILRIARQHWILLFPSYNDFAARKKVFPSIGKTGLSSSVKGGLKSNVYESACQHGTTVPFDRLTLKSHRVRKISKHDLRHHGDFRTEYWPWPR
eukprot:3304859-Pleurochrysis_carterae.AAC.1